MKVNEFLEQERSQLAAAEEQARAAAADAYTAGVNAFPYQCRKEFLGWLSDGGDIPHDVFPAISASCLGPQRGARPAGRQPGLRPGAARPLAGGPQPRVTPDASHRSRRHRERCAVAARPWWAGRHGSCDRAPGNARRRRGATGSNRGRPATGGDTGRNRSGGTSPAMNIVLAGATGYIGRPLIAALHAASHRLVVLTRRPSETSGLPSGVELAEWDGRTATGSLAGVLDGAGAVINLSGANIGARRWTEARKQELLQSRIEPLAALTAAIAELPAGRRPGVLVSASGIDYYGDRGDEVVTEDSPPGDSFLARLCVSWEEAARKAEPLGLRVVSIRTAVVIGRGADVVKRLALPFRLFAGGPLGSGDQWFAWIHLEDIVGLYRLAVENEAAQGPLNAVAPDVRRMRDVATEMGRAMGRPSWAPAPAFALRAVLGEQADLVLHGRRAEPRRALALGYQFKYPDLPGALVQALGGS